MNVEMFILGILACVGAFFEYCQHNDYAKKHPDYDKCPSGVFGFIILALIAIIKSFI